MIRSFRKTLGTIATERLELIPGTPATVRAALAGDGALASALIFRYDPRHGIIVQREVKHAPWKGRPPTTGGTGDRLGTIGLAAVSTAWVETKSLSFIEAVLKAN